MFTLGTVSGRWHTRTRWAAIGAAIAVPIGRFALADPGTGTECVTGDTFLIVTTTDLDGTLGDRDFTFAIFFDG